MSKDYVAQYSKGEIYVYFHEDTNEGFAADFGKQLGFKFIPSGGPYYLFETEIGKEKKAITKFKKYKEFVRYSGRRDTRLEKRFDFVDDLVSKVRSLDEYFEKEDFLKELNKLKKYIERFDDSTI